MIEWIKNNPIKSLLPGGIAYGVATEADPAAGIEAFKDYVEKMNELVRGSFEEGATAGAAIARQVTTDSLARIGIFKGRSDSELQTLKASLIVQRGIQVNTDGLISAVTNA